MRPRRSTDSQFTVIGYTDGERGVHSFVQFVWASSKSEAWDIAVEKCREEWEGKGLISERGVPIYGDDADGACEIVTYHGHLTELH